METAGERKAFILLKLKSIGKALIISNNTSLYTFVFQKSA